MIRVADVQTNSGWPTTKLERWYWPARDAPCYAITGEKHVSNPAALPYAKKKHYKISLSDAFHTTATQAKL